MALPQFPFYEPDRFYTSTHNLTKYNLVKGRIYEDRNGDKWRLMKLGTALSTSTANGQSLVSKDPESWIVTNDVSDSFDTTYPRPSGIVTGVFSSSGTATDADSGLVNNDKWVLLLIRGVHTAVKTDGGNDIVEGDILMPSASVDGGVDRLLFGTTQIANPADSPATADALRDDLVTNALAQIRASFEFQVKCAFAFALEADVDATDVVKAFINLRW